MLWDGSANDQAPPRPTMQPSAESAKDADEQDAAQVQLEKEENAMAYKIDYSDWSRRKSAYHDNVKKAYTFLWQHCTKVLQGALEADPEYDNFKHDAIALLAAIKQHALDYQQKKHPLQIVLDSICQSLNLRMKDDETLNAHTKRFVAASDVLRCALAGR